jgi:hypothetical protein
LPHLSAYGVEPVSTRLGLVAARESPNAIDADLMSHDIDDRPVFRSFVIVRRLGSVALALLDLLLRGVSWPCPIRC